MYVDARLVHWLSYVLLFESNAFSRHIFGLEQNSSFRDYIKEL